MLCDECLMRMFDDDARDAVPADVAVHLAQCADCATQWQQEALLKKQWQADVPASVYQRAYAQIVQLQDEDLARRSRWQMISIAVLCGSALAALMWLTPWADSYPSLPYSLFVVGGGLGFLQQLWADPGAE